MFIFTSPLAMSAPTTLETRGLKSCYKNAALTMYWIPKEGETDMANNGKIVHLTGPKSKALKTTAGKTISKVSKTTYEKFQMEGTGLLQNGKMVNLDSDANTFMLVNRKKAPYGIGSDDDISLVPWVSVASNDLKRGTKLYIKNLDGKKLPNGKVHNGCVRVDDQGWSFEGCQLDFFVLEFAAYRILDKTLSDKVSVQQKDCKILNYVNSAVKQWAELS
ncbi:hypothetical protein BX666DRAFT_1851034 [Dichotomocladium elegans]|nr:hypothetical protein BX666DRAFT_1851034 [Dichotomocladium elegans]